MQKSPEAGAGGETSVAGVSGEDRVRALTGH